MATVPVTVAVCTKRNASRMTSSPLRRMWRGSSIAGKAPCQVRSISTPSAGASHTKRTVFRPSTTSTRIGPTSWRMRSSLSAPEVRSEVSERPRRVAT